MLYNRKFIQKLKTTSSNGRAGATKIVKFRNSKARQYSFEKVQ